MLSNEAAFAAGEGIAEVERIDTAMILGMNYPKGPIAWANEIGYQHVVEVLEHLQREYGEERYRTAPLLQRLARLEKINAR
jgi:3-hydroxybutyryl-CoA dehydrogenase